MLAHRSISYGKSPCAPRPRRALVRAYAAAGRVRDAPPDARARRGQPPAGGLESSRLGAVSFMSTEAGGAGLAGVYGKSPFAPRPRRALVRAYAAAGRVRDAPPAARASRGQPPAGGLESSRLGSVSFMSTEAGGAGLVRFALADGWRCRLLTLRDRGNQASPLAAGRLPAGRWRTLRASEAMRSADRV